MLIDGNGKGKTTALELVESARREAESSSLHELAVQRGPLPDCFPGYTVVREIHRGGQGIVYEAMQRNPRRKVAIKVLRGAVFAGQVDFMRLQREAEILGRLKHPGLVSVIEAGVTGEVPFVVVEFVDGESLDVYLRNRQLNVENLLHLFAKICRAVHAAHLQGVIHRDLKPNNILIDSANEPHVLDFGLGRQTDTATEASAPSITCTGQFVGSLPWASPEQVDDRLGPVDIRTDVYSLGVLLFWSVTGEHPYDVHGPQSLVISNITTSSLLRPSTIRKGLNDDVDTIVLKCLAKEPNRRYQSAGEVASDIERYLNGEAIDAKRASALYVLARMMVRHKKTVATIGAFLGLLLISVVVSLSLYARSLSAERDEKRRYAELRQLARSVILDFDSQLRKGPTAAREFYVSTALPYLSGLGDDALNDPDLLAEVIAGYVRVADVQGNASYSNLGDLIGAMRTLEIAKNLVERGLRRFPESWDLRAQLATTYERIGDLQNYSVGFSTEDALETFNRTLTIRQELVVSDPTNGAKLRDIGSILLRIGNMELSLDRREAARQAYLGALKWQQRRVELEPNIPDAWLCLARNYRALGDAAYLPGNEGESQEWYGKAYKTLLSEVLSQDDAEVRHERIRLEQRLGRHEANRGNHAAALQKFLACKSITDATSLADPDDVRAMEDGWHCGDEAARTLALLGRYPQALELANENLALAKDVRRSGSARKNSLTRVAFSHGRLGQLLLETADLPSALNNFQRSSEILESLDAGDGATLSWKHSLTDVYHRLAVTCIALAESTESKSACTRQHLLSEARTYVAKGFDVLASLPGGDDRHGHVEWSGELECKLEETHQSLMTAMR